jgi:ribosome biogenesis protein NSA1
MRLNDWRLSPSGRDTFAYAGHEVELSLWDVDRAFSQPPSTKETLNASIKGKRKRNEPLLPGEIWRARNV